MAGLTRKAPESTTRRHGTQEALHSGAEHSGIADVVARRLGGALGLPPRALHSADS